MSQVVSLRAWPEGLQPSTKSGRRVYVVPGVGDMRSVTTVEKMLGIGTDALVGWAARTEKEAVLQAVREQFTWAQGMTGDAFVNQIEKGLGEAKAHIRKMNQAADIGTATHAMIQWRLKTDLNLDPGPRPVLSDESQWAYMAWETWFDRSGLKPIRIEQVVYDADLGIAGMIDLIAENESNELEVLDWKVSNYILLQHHVQVSVYKHMASLWRPIRRARIARIPKVYDKTELEIVDLGDTYDMQKKARVLRSETQLLRIFGGALEIYKGMEYGAAD